MSENENTEELLEPNIPEKAEESGRKPIKQKKSQEPEEPAKPFSGAMEWAGSLIYAVLAMLLLNLFVFRSITVDGESMNNTLQDQDRVLSTNFFYTPSRGDIVVLQADKVQNYKTGRYGEPIIKRVIALAGDTIKFDFEKGEVYLKKAGEQEFQLLEEDFIAAPTMAKLDRHTGEEHIVPEHCVFVMGDNRNRSLDSRSQLVGDVDTDLIMGRAFVRLFPIDQFTLL